MKSVMASMPRDYLRRPDGVVIVGENSEEFG